MKDLAFYDPSVSIKGDSFLLQESYVGSGAYDFGRIFDVWTREWSSNSFPCGALLGVLGMFDEWFTANTREFLGGLIKWVLDMGLIVCLGYLLLSGVIGWLCGGMSSWVLVGHMMAGGGFAGCAVLLMAIRAKERTTKLWSGVVWAFWVLFAAGTIFTAVMPMMTVFGSHGQEILLWSHRCVSLCFACASAVLCQLLRLRK